MQQYGTENLSAYLRKMALDGYVVKLELPELKELVSLMRRSSNNLNQLTRKVHETGRVYDADLEDIDVYKRQVQDDWFSDDLKKLDDENVYRKMQGHWLIEMSEMIATANAKSIRCV